MNFLSGERATARSVFAVPALNVVFIHFRAVTSNPISLARFSFTYKEQEEVLILL